VVSSELGHVERAAARREEDVPRSDDAAGDVAPLETGESHAEAIEEGDNPL
jgi:hypothetical protein